MFPVRAVCTSFATLGCTLLKNTPKTVFFVNKTYLPSETPLPLRKH
ncbi:hypothetical protein ACFX1X_010506 [Malus domestica]